MADKEDINTTAGKERFVHNLTRSVASPLIKAIRDGRIPADWDGHELRVALADIFASDALCSVIREKPRSARARAYRRVMANAGRL